MQLFSAPNPQADVCATVSQRQLTEDDPDLLSMTHGQDRLSHPILLTIPSISTLFPPFQNAIIPSSAPPVISHIGDIPWGGCEDHLFMGMWKGGIVLSTSPIFAQGDEDGRSEGRNPWACEQEGQWRMSTKD